MSVPGADSEIYMRLRFGRRVTADRKNELRVTGETALAVAVAKAMRTVQCSIGLLCPRFRCILNGDSALPSEADAVCHLNMRVSQGSLDSTGFRGCADSVLYADTELGADPRKEGWVCCGGQSVRSPFTSAQLANWREPFPLGGFHRKS